MSPFFFIEMVYDWLLSHMEDPKFPPFHAVLEPFLSFDMPWPFNDHGMLYLKKRDLSSSVGQMPVHLYCILLQKAALQNKNKGHPITSEGVAYANGRFIRSCKLHLLHDLFKQMLNVNLLGNYNWIPNRG